MDVQWLCCVRCDVCTVHAGVVSVSHGHCVQCCAVRAAAVPSAHYIQQCWVRNSCAVCAVVVLCVRWLCYVYSGTGLCAVAVLHYQCVMLP